MLSAMLETGEWQMEGNEVVIKVASSATVIEMSLGADAKRLIDRHRQRSAGTAGKLKVFPGGVAQAARRDPVSSNGGGRGRAEQDPVVQPHEGKVRSRDSHDYRLQGKALSIASVRRDIRNMGGFNLQELMSQAKQQYETLQKKMEETVVEGSSGGGTVTVKMDGRKQVLSIKIDPEAVKAGDLEMLQDLITAAINGAGRKVDEAMQSTMGGMLGGMGIPGL